VKPPRIFGLLVTAQALILASLGGCLRPAEAQASSLPDVEWAKTAIQQIRLGRSRGKVRYVARWGANGAAGTKLHPWRTVQHGLDALRPGWTLLIRSGTYRQNLIMRRAGSGVAPISVRNYPGDHPVLRGRGTPAHPLEVAGSASYVRFRGLVFAGATGYRTTNIYVSGSADHIEFSNCVSRDSEGQGLFSDRGTSSIRVIGCYFHDNGGGEAPNHGHNLYLEGSRHVIANNVIAGAKRGFGIQLYPASDRVVIASNTIVANREDGLLIGSEGSEATTNAIVVNNILAFNGRYGLSTYWGGAVGTGNYAINNLAWANRSGGLSVRGVSVLGAKTGNPHFVDRRKRNFRLKADSAARDKALASLSPGSDYRGLRRPQGPGDDIGAFERPR